MAQIHLAAVAEIRAKRHISGPVLRSTTVHIWLLALLALFRCMLRSDASSHNLHLVYTALLSLVIEATVNRTHLSAQLIIVPKSPIPQIWTVEREAVLCHNQRPTTSVYDYCERRSGLIRLVDIISAGSAHNAYAMVYLATLAHIRKECPCVYVAPQ